MIQALVIVPDQQTVAPARYGLHWPLPVEVPELQCPTPFILPLWVEIQYQTQATIEREFIIPIEISVQFERLVIGIHKGIYLCKMALIDCTMPTHVLTFDLNQIGVAIRTLQRTDQTRQSKQQDHLLFAVLRTS